MLSDLAIEGVAVDAEDLSGLGLISTGFGKSGLDESSFEFAHSFFEINLALDHFRYKGLQLLFHNCLPCGMDFLSAAATSAPARGNRPEILLSFHTESLLR